MLQAPEHRFPIDPKRPQWSTPRCNRWVWLGGSCSLGRGKLFSGTAGDGEEPRMQWAVWMGSCVGPMLEQPVPAGLHSEECIHVGAVLELLPV